MAIEPYVEASTSAPSSRRAVVVWVSTAVSAALVLASVLWFALVPEGVAGLQDAVSPERIAEVLTTLGFAGVLLFILSLAVSVVIGPVPSAPFAIAAGLTYGAVPGTLVSITGAVLGAVTSFMIARLAARGLIARLRPPSVLPSWAQSDRALFAVVLLARLIPINSFALVSYGAGLTAITLRSFIVATVLGMAPMTFALATIGASHLISFAWLVGGAFAILTAVIVLSLIRGHPAIDTLASGTRSVGQELRELLERHLRPSQTPDREQPCDGSTATARTTKIIIGTQFEEEGHKMADTAIEKPNEFVEFWNDILVPKFVRFKHVLVGGLGHHSAKVFPTLEVNPGDTVVDVGCGFGDTAIELATRVGPSGTVLGIDCCEAFLDFGRADAKAAGLENITFVEADVQTYPFEPVHDFCFSRFGTQFFENPVAGLRNMRNSLKPGGIMTMIVWRTIDDNPWLGLAKNVVLKHLPPPGDDARTCGPGPFSMANQEMVTKQLEVAGYTDPVFERIDAPLFVGSTLDDAVDFQLTLGPAGEVYREAGERAEQQHDAIVDALKAELAKYETPEGVILDSSSWKITARKPA